MCGCAGKKLSIVSLVWQPKRVHVKGTGQAMNTDKVVILLQGF